MKKFLILSCKQFIVNPFQLFQKSCPVDKIEIAFEFYCSKICEYLRFAEKLQSQFKKPASVLNSLIDKKAYNCEGFA